MENNEQELTTQQLKHWEQQLEYSKKAFEVACRMLGRRTIDVITNYPELTGENDA